MTRELAARLKSSPIQHPVLASADAPKLDPDPAGRFLAELDAEVA